MSFAYIDVVHSCFLSLPGVQRLLIYFLDFFVDILIFDY